MRNKVWGKNMHSIHVEKMSNRMERYKNGALKIYNDMEP